MAVIYYCPHPSHHEDGIPKTPPTRAGNLKAIGFVVIFTALLVIVGVVLAYLTERFDRNRRHEHHTTYITCEEQQVVIASRQHRNKKRNGACDNTASSSVPQSPYCQHCWDVCVHIGPGHHERYITHINCEDRQVILAFRQNQNTMRCGASEKTASSSVPAPPYECQCFLSKV